MRYGAFGARPVKIDTITITITIIYNYFRYKEEIHNMLCPLLTNLVRQILLENLLSDVASVPMVPQQILKIWQSYRLTKKRECVVRGQRQILPNQIEGPRKFNDIFQEKKIWASIASWNNLEEYFNKPIWGSCGGKPIFLTGQKMLKVLYHTKIWRWWVEIQLEKKLKVRSQLI